VPDARPTRRDLLAWSARLGGGAVLGSGLVACSDEEEPPDPTTLLVDAVTRRERALLARARATLEAHSGLRGRVEPVVADHRRHLAALGRRATPTPTGDATPTATPDPPSVPGSASAARLALGRAEDQAARATLDALGEAPGTLARLLASIAANEAAHHSLLVSPEPS
jgi:hypothetical protein